MVVNDPFMVVYGGYLWWFIMVPPGMVSLVASGSAYCLALGLGLGALRIRSLEIIAAIRHCNWRVTLMQVVPKGWAPGWSAPGFIQFTDVHCG